MSDDYKKLYIDFLPNQPKADKTRENFRDKLRGKLDERLEASVERIWDLPQLAVEPEGEYLSLLLEARDLYVDGRFYSCVAMCGIVGERLIKDLIRASVLIQEKGATKTPSEEAFDQLEHVEIYGLVNFLNRTGILSDESASASKKLVELRNKYAHARGKDPKTEALKAIQLVHAIVEGTVSVFKDFEIRDGALVAKQKPTNI